MMMTTVGRGMEKNGARILWQDRLGIGLRKEEQADEESNKKESGHMNMLIVVKMTNDRQDAGMKAKGQNRWMKTGRDLDRK